MDCDDQGIPKISRRDPSDISSSRSDEESKDVLKIKFKLSRAEEVPNNPMIRVCEYCGKEFSNGKALGGHIRIHTKGSKKIKPDSTPRIKKELLVHRADDSMDINWENNFDRICPICDRVFSSVKSLFCHMRFHPERHWRGLQPPGDGGEKSLLYSSLGEEVDGNPNGKYSSSGSADLSIDLLKELPNWSKTDKRGRGSTCEAALNLIKLASGVPPDWAVIKETLNPNKPAEMINCKRKTLISSGPEEIRAEAPRKGRVRFICNTCGRVFPTFQALGGHRSSHNKGKTTASNLPRYNNNGGHSQSVSASTDNAVEKKIIPALVGLHRCEICQKNFRSGQALGGHKRCHWATGHGPSSSEVAPPGPMNEYPDDQASQVGPGPRAAMDIDLNKLPFMEDEDGSVSGNS